MDTRFDARQTLPTDVAASAHSDLSAQVGPVAASTASIRDLELHKLAIKIHRELQGIELNESERLFTDHGGRVLNNMPMQVLITKTLSGRQEPFFVDERVRDHLMASSYAQNRPMDSQVARHILKEELDMMIIPDHRRIYTLKEIKNFSTLPVEVQIQAEQRVFDGDSRVVVSRPGPEFVVIQDKSIISRASSIYESARAAEVAVVTTNGFRQKGAGTATVGAWALHIQESGRAPYYEHRDENKASAALARKLGFELLFQDQRLYCYGTRTGTGF